MVSTSTALPVSFHRQVLDEDQFCVDDRLGEATLYFESLRTADVADFNATPLQGAHGGTITFTATWKPDDPRQMLGGSDALKKAIAERQSNAAALSSALAKEESERVNAKGSLEVHLVQASAQRRVLRRCTFSRLRTAAYFQDSNSWRRDFLRSLCACPRQRPSVEDRHWHRTRTLSCAWRASSDGRPSW